jgi:hypothetical protein
VEEYDLSDLLHLNTNSLAEQLRRQKGVKTANAGVGRLGTSRVKSTRILNGFSGGLKKVG